MKFYRILCHKSWRSNLVSFFFGVPWWKDWRFVGLDVFCSCFVLTKLSISGFSCLPLSVVLLIFSLRKPKENRTAFWIFWSYTCLFGRGKCHSQVAVWLVFKMFNNFFAWLSVQLCFFLFSFSFPVFPCPKSRRCCTAQETEATQDDSLSGASGGLAVSKIETIIDSPKKCVWTGWVHLHLTKLCIV